LTFKNEGATLQNNNTAVALSQLTPTGQPPSTELLTQVVQYIIENLHVDLSVLALECRFSLEESALLLAFESHTGVALEPFVRRRIERALHPLRNSDARDSEIAAGVIWEVAPAFQVAFLNYPEEVCRRNSRRRVARGASVRPGLLAYRRKNLVDGRFRHSQSSNQRGDLVKRCGQTTARKEAS
jgi:AraC-like DNA-binding protein